MRIVTGRLKWIVVVAVIVGTSSASAQAASAPTKITVQGRLTDPSGTPAPAGSKPFVFKIYDAATLGTEIWPNGVGENQNVNTDANGLWTAEVGSVIPLTSPVFNAPTRWLQIIVNGEELSRIAINTTPFAYRVATLQGADAGDVQGVMGVRDPGGDDSLLIGPGGMTFHTSGGATTGPRGITFIDPGGDTALSYSLAGGDALFEMRGDTGTISVDASGSIDRPRQLLLTTADVVGYSDSGFTGVHSGPMLVLRDTLGMNANDVLVSAGGGLAYRGTNTGNGYFGPGGLLMTQGPDTTVFFEPTGPSWRVGINTGHPTEALTVGGAARMLIDNLTPTDPWVGARRSIVIAQESADDWGRSGSDSAGIYLPAHTSDYSILSSKTSANQTILRMSVGDDPDDHILLMPSGNVGIGTTTPSEKLDISGNLRATRMALGNALINPNQALVATENVATSDWGMRISNTGGGARVGVSSVSSNLAILDLESNGSDRWALGKGSGAENFFVSSDAVGTVLTIERSTGNVGIGSGTASHPLEMIASGAHCTAGGTWTNSSDSSLKVNVTAINADDLLARISHLPIHQWNYRAEDPSIRHIGPMAQDFHAAFGLGEDDKHITTIDADGVAMAAIQSLNQKLNDQKSENADLRARIEALERLVQELTVVGVSK